MPVTFDIPCPSRLYRMKVYSKDASEFTPGQTGDTFPRIEGKSDLVMNHPCHRHGGKGCGKDGDMDASQLAVV